MRSARTSSQDYTRGMLHEKKQKPSFWKPEHHHRPNSWMGKQTSYVDSATKC